jgi:hypothetical protein
MTEGPDPDTLYRVHRPKDEFDTFTSKEFFSLIGVDVPVGKPECPYLPEGEWYCQNEECVVREVRVAMKYIGERPPRKPPALKCPLCGMGALNFHHYFKRVTLEPSCPE